MQPALPPIVIRSILGFTPPEWACVASQRKREDIDQDFARDVEIRGRKRYVAPTPFALTVGTAHNQTLILPTGSRVDSRFQEVGRLIRREPEKLVIAYAFAPRANTLVPELVVNPSAGREHSFSAFRLKGVGGEEVAMRLSGESSEAPAWDEPDARVAWS